MMTLEKIADLDRRGLRESAIAAAMFAEAAGMRAAAYEWWPFGKRYHERVARRREISRALDMLLHTPEQSVVTLPFPAGQYVEMRALLDCEPPPESQGDSGTSRAP